MTVAPLYPRSCEIAELAVMGTTARIVVVGCRRGVASEAGVWLTDLERRWSRFRQDSEISACNRGAGQPVVVSEPTRTLVRAGITAWASTAGVFDPTVFDAMVAGGYGEGGFGDDDRPAGPRDRAPGLAGVQVDAAAGTVRLPVGVHFDPGGLGKGLAADLVVDGLRRLGASGALVDVGGDIRAWGDAPEGAGWAIGVQDPFDVRRDDARLAIGDGAVATSSRLGRYWLRDGETQHHIVDPRTGRPTEGAVVATTVIAGAAWWAEVVATALVVRDGELFDGAGDVSALVWHADGTRRTIGPVERYLVPQGSQEG